MALTKQQIQQLTEEELAEYEALDAAGKEQFEYFFGFTTHKAAAVVVQNKEVLEYQKAAENIHLKTIATMLEFTPHEGQQPLFFSFDAQRDVYNNFVLLFGRRAQTLDSIICTPGGDVTFNDVTQGTVICDPQGGTQTVTQVHDVYDGDVYKVTLGYGIDKDNGSRSMKCDSHHLFSVTDHQGNERVLSVEQMLPIYKSGEYYEFKVYNPEPLEFNEVELPQDPYEFGSSPSTKFIPDVYLHGSIEQRLALLQGLMDTDGSVASDSVAEYTTTSKELAEGVKALVLSLGGSVKLIEKNTTYNKNRVRIPCSVAYHTLISLNLNPFRLKRKADKYTPKRCYNFITSIESIDNEPVRCISVSSKDKNYITDDYCVTHNTGKSEVTSVVAIRELFLPHSSTVLLTPVFENAKIIFGNVLKKIEQLGLPIKTINRGSFRIELENGARFSANSAANVEAALGSSNSLLIVDETQSIPDIKRIMNQLLVPTTLDYGIRPSGILWAHQILLGTPRGEENELTDYFYNELTMNNWKSFTAASTSNPILPTQYIENMRAELGDILFRQEILAEIIGSDENVFHAFDRTINLYNNDAPPPANERPEGWTSHNYFQPTADSLYIDGIDIGWSDSTANLMIYRTSEGRYYVQKAYSENNTTTSKHIKNYKEMEDGMIGECDIRYGDPAAAQTLNDYTADYDYDVVPAKNDISASIKYINNLFSPTGANQEPRLYIHESLGELIRQISRIRYKKIIGKKSSDPFIKDPDGTHWDLIAALRYALFSDQYNVASLNIISS